MRISLERTGGFAGITKKTTVDTAELPANEAKTLPQLVEAADLFRLPERITSPNPQSDRFQYKLTVEDNGKQHTVTVSEAALPGTLRPLIEWLQNISQKKIISSINNLIFNKKSNQVHIKINAQGESP